MKALCTAVLAATLLFSGCGLLNRSVGYDIGACSPGKFVAAHLVYRDGKSVTFTEFQTGPDTNMKPEKPVVYQYTSTDDNGKHYSHNDLVLVIKEAGKGKISGVFLNDGEVVAMVYGVAADGTQLAKNANVEVNVCRGLQGTQGSGPAPDSAQAQ
jgi:hypothetical protein